MKIKKEDGVTVVYNPRKPVSQPGAPIKLTLTEDLVIGDESDDEDYMFSQLRSIQVDDQENIIVLDIKDVSIKIFDKNGKFKSKFGKKGQGPGEIMLPFAMFLVSGKHIVINDSQNTRIAYFTIDGQCIKEIKSGTIRAFAVIPDSRGHIYADAVEFGDDVTIDLIKFDQNFKPISTLASMEMPDEPPPALLMKRFVFVVKNDDSLLWGKSNAYEVHWLDRYGNTIRKIVKDSKPRKANLNNLKLEYTKLYPDRKIPDIKQPPPHFPKHFPLFRSFISDDEGRIFVQTWDRADDDHFWYDVFDADGLYVYRFPHPDGEVISVVKKGKAYCMIRANEEGIPLIKRYMV
ncbi:MAG: 6-bladed beta-propeller, partial [Proteobacteria bacterium]|nr:6-bladed beta-propeller [Pseudomonadota bacterium]